MDSAAARQVGVALEAMLLAPILRPVFAGSDALGDYGLGAIAQEIASHDGGGFAALVAARVEGLR